MSNIKNSQSYTNRDFDSIRSEIIDLIKVHYPDQFQDFNAAGVGMSLVDLLAYVSDLLSYNTDKKFNEQFIDGVTERTAVYRLAKTFGFKVPGFRPSLTLVDITIEVPTTADGPNVSYLPLIRPGMQVKGAGQTFETINEVDFSSDFSELGTANRKIQPVINPSTQDILRYKITKRELVKAGATKIYRQEITLKDASTPFLEVSIPDDTNILEIVSVIAKPGVGQSGIPTYQDFNNDDYRYYEVDELAEDKVFMEDNSIPSQNGVKTGRYKAIKQRFIKEYMSDGSCKLIFGGGTPNVNGYEEYISKLAIGAENQIKIQDILDNSSLGVKLPANSTLYVKYRIGGGIQSNVGEGVLTQVGSVNTVIMGSNAATNEDVLSSLKVINVLPAIGGAGLPSVDEVKHFISSNFASQKRCVTLKDYIARASQIPGKFGSPFRIHGKVEDNKVKLFILTRDANGKLIPESNSVIKSNMVEYLSQYRSINDFVEINDGKVINISMEVDIYTDKTFNSNEVKLNVINKIVQFFDIEKWQMNQHIYIAQIIDEVRETPGVINVVDIRFFNMEGGGIYSDTLIAQSSGQRESILGTNIFRTQIELINNAIYSTPISMFEVRFPEQDIKVRVS
jgi:hypothetical protein